ncbi:MAG: biopolymer transporter ExbD [Sulfuricella denitrificans]|nr:biopolymer transporter ExbD [Sulfuricella denitrificans]
MRRWHEEKKPRARIEIIPMIDVMMFLLVFFVLISINVIPAFNIKTRLPSSSSAEKTLEQHNTVVSLGQNSELQLDGTHLGLDELTPRLAAIRLRDPQVSVIIHGDRAVQLQRIIDVMDRVKSAGFPALSIAVKKSGNP